MNFYFPISNIITIFFYKNVRFIILLEFYWYKIKYKYNIHNTKVLPKAEAINSIPKATVYVP